MKKILVLLLLFAACKSNDPTPAANVLEWKFFAITQTQGDITATSYDCFETELQNAHFTNDGWKLADQPNITFNTTSTNPLDAATVSYFNVCSNVTTTMNLLSTRGDSTTTIKLVDPAGSAVTQQLIVKNKDLAASTVPALLYNTYGYTVTYKFVRSPVVTE